MMSIEFNKIIITLIISRLMFHERKRSCIAGSAVSAEDVLCLLHVMSKIILPIS